MTPQFKLAAITDEFSPDLATALEAMAPIGMTGAELRVVFGKNIMDLDADQLKQAKDLLAQHGMTVVAIASPLLKCVLDGGPVADTRFQQDIFNAKHTCAEILRQLKSMLCQARLIGESMLRIENILLETRVRNGAAVEHALQQR